ncbi:hypothetical protein ABVK25_006486 [Lepraria finkii]|uniref:Uncharacterized protein n=1 Tax=Lepraria finkii TaxID=1340010 RepID=A0ABR4B8G0_9LECA
MTTKKRSFKRPFQPSISSYFGHARDSDFSPAAAPQSSVLSPNYPANIQSSLLNVGMRVRKSVPEGYITRPKTICGFQMPFDRPSSLPDHSHNHNRSASTGFNGLLPYCGILKVGGHGVQQPVLAEEDIPPLQFDHDDWGFLSSQESNISCIFTSSASMFATPPIPIRATNNNKRRREDSDEEDLDLDSQPVSPRSRPISHTRMPNLDQIRPVAVPRSRRKMIQTGDGEIKESEMIDVGDFWEAEFFRPDAWGGGCGGFEGNMIERPTLGKWR